jgi:hypothetical protein
MKATVNGVEYEQVDKKSAAILAGLERSYKVLGEPQDASNETGWKMIDVLFRCWQLQYPLEVEDWKERLANELDGERTAREAVKASGGYFPISYPTRFHRMLEMYLPNQKLQDRSFIRKMVARYPILKSTNLKV